MKGLDVIVVNCAISACEQASRWTTALQLLNRLMCFGWRGGGEWSSLQQNCWDMLLLLLLLLLLSLLSVSVSVSLALLSLLYLIKPHGKSQSGKKKLSQAGQASVTGNCAFPRRGLARPQAWMVVESVDFWRFWVGSNYCIQFFKEILAPEWHSTWSWQACWHQWRWWKHIKASTWNFHVPHNATLQEILAIVQWWCDRQHPSIQLRQLALVLCNGSEACGCEVAIGVGKMPRDHSTCIHLPSHIPSQAGWSLNSCRKRWGWWEDINDLSPFAFGFPGFTCLHWGFQNCSMRSSKWRLPLQREKLGKWCTSMVPILGLLGFQWGSTMFLSHWAIGPQGASRHHFLQRSHLCLWLLAVWHEGLNVPSWGRMWLGMDGSGRWMMRFIIIKQLTRLRVRLAWCADFLGRVEVP